LLGQKLGGEGGNLREKEALGWVNRRQNGNRPGARLTDEAEKKSKGIQSETEGREGEKWPTKPPGNGLCLTEMVGKAKISVRERWHSYATLVQVEKGEEN